MPSKIPINFNYNVHRPNDLPYIFQVPNNSKNDMYYLLLL